MWIFFDYERRTSDLLPVNIRTDYYNDDLSDRQSDDCAELVLARYDDYLNHELPKSVLKELKIVMEKEKGNSEDKEKCVEENLPNIIRSCMEQLSRTYEESSPPAPTISSNEPSASATNSDENHAVIGSDIYAAGPSDQAYYEVLGELFDDHPAWKVPDETPLDFWEFPESFNAELANFAGITVNTSIAGVLGPGKGKGRADVAADDGSQEPTQYQEWLLEFVPGANCI